MALLSWSTSCSSNPFLSDHSLSYPPLALILLILTYGLNCMGHLLIWMLILLEVIQSWYVMGRLGAFNSSNLQLANASMEYDPLYDADKGFKVMPSSFHDIGDVEFQDNWGIQQVVFGGRRMGDWEDDMTNPEYGYKYFKI
ncbi:Protein of unknown function DUF3531 [Dillenia turbinata]|uniref:Uncharacterized protein n=1 Tax=Dillenia turbinata TaxID=194707 RepID=A0AAN8UYE0_9MAGN